MENMDGGWAPTTIEPGKPHTKKPFARKEGPFLVVFFGNVSTTGKMDRTLPGVTQDEITDRAPLSRK